MIEVKCDMCSKIVLKKKWQYNKYKNHFCSRECHDKFQLLSKERKGSDCILYTKVEIICDQCGNYFMKVPSQIEGKKNNFCSQKCHYEFKGGRKDVICDTCGMVFHKISSHVLSKNYCSRKCKDIAHSILLSGENNHWWNGGITPLYEMIRGNLKYMAWRKMVLERDNWTCTSCHKRGGNIHSHHLKHFKDIIKDNNIKSLDEGINCSELWDINNGITLCTKCHKKEHKIKNRKLKVA